MGAKEGPREDHRGGGSEYDPAFRSHYGKRSPLAAAVSHDEGRTRKHVRDIEDDPTRAFSNPGCRFTRSENAIVNRGTCESLPDWAMQDIIDLRVAIVDRQWSCGATAPWRGSTTKDAWSQPARRSRS